MSDDTNAGQPEAPTNSAGNGRGPDGKFVVGNPGGPGRKRRPDIYLLAERFALQAGIDLQEKLSKVIEAMVDKAVAGDTTAAKLILDRLTDSDPVKLEVGVDPSQRVAQIRALLEAAAIRGKVGQ